MKFFKLLKNIIELLKALVDSGTPIKVIAEHGKIYRYLVKMEK